jgi:hypothetical protein
MNRLTLAATIFSCFFIPASARAQSVARLHHATPVVASSDEMNTKAIAALKRLENQAIVYRSLGEFEAGSRLANVPLQKFEQELFAVTTELQPIVASMPESKLRNEIINSLASYRDGLFWWRKIDKPRVVHVSALSYSESNRTPSDEAFLSSIPYTVAIHWRQAAHYLDRAQALVGKQSR